MKRFLMLAYFFPPMGDGGVFRSLKLARYLPRHGWKPVVVCGRPEDYWIRDDSLLDQLPEDLEVHRVGGLTGQGLLRRFRGGAAAAPSSRRSSGTWRRLRALGELALMPDSYAGWIRPARGVAKKVLAAGGIELIYSSGPPDSAHLVARDLAAESGLPWVADFRDPWFNLHLKDPPSALHRLWHRRLESRVLAEAQVVAVTEGWRRRYAEQCERPPVLIRNGYDPEDFAQLPPPTAETKPGLLKIVHTGKLSLTRSARPFLEGLSRCLAQHPELREALRVEFLGPRESDNDLAAAALGLQDIVRFEDAVSHSESLRRQRGAHVLLLIKHDNLRYRDLVPGKFYEYIAAERPILAITPVGELSGMMERHQLGWSLRPDAADIAARLPEILAAAGSGWRPPLAAPVELTRPEQARRMAALFDETLTAATSTAKGVGQ